MDQDSDYGIGRLKQCSNCGEIVGGTKSWRWVSDHWQHRCPGTPPQAGHKDMDDSNLITDTSFQVYEMPRIASMTPDELRERIFQLYQAAELGYGWICNWPTSTIKEDDVAFQATHARSIQRIGDTLYGKRIASNTADLILPLRSNPFYPIDTSGIESFANMVEASADAEMHISIPLDAGQAEEARQFFNGIRATRTDEVGEQGKQA